MRRRHYVSQIVQVNGRIFDEKLCADDGAQYLPTSAQPQSTDDCSLMPGVCRGARSRTLKFPPVRAAFQRRAARRMSSCVIFNSTVAILGRQLVHCFNHAVFPHQGLRCCMAIAWAAIAACINVGTNEGGRLEAAQATLFNGSVCSEAMEAMDVSTVMMSMLHAVPSSSIARLRIQAHHITSVVRHHARIVAAAAQQQRCT